MDPIEEWWAERAAIMHYDGGMPRTDAEYAAYALTIRRFGSPLPRTRYFDSHRLGEAELRWPDETASVEYVAPRPAWILWEKYPDPKR